MAVYHEEAHRAFALLWRGMKSARVRRVKEERHRVLIPGMGWGWVVENDEGEGKAKNDLATRFDILFWHTVCACIYACCLAVYDLCYTSPQSCCFVPLLHCLSCTYIFAHLMVG